LTKENVELSESLEESRKIATELAEENQASFVADEAGSTLPQIRQTVRELWKSVQALKDDDILDQLRRLTDQLERLETGRRSYH
jgi:hypothetical protein